jgi:hemerythrin-like domain-containing protein
MGGDREPEIDGLIDEHRELMTIMATLRNAAGEPDSDVGGLLDELETALAHHTEREEAGLFHTLHEVEVPPEYIGLFEHDHGFLVELIVSTRSDRNRVDDLLKSLEAHMGREENDMFPAAEQLLGPTDWDAVEAAVAHLR